MEYKKRAIDWLLANKDELKLKVTRMTWSEKYCQDLHDLNVSLSVDGQEYIGRGTDFDSQDAFLKGSVEALERYVVDVNRLRSSNGVAGHLSLESAQQAAFLELEERDAFLCHYLTFFPFKKSSILLKKNYSQTLTQLTNIGVHFHFGKMKTKSNLTAFACIASGLYRQTQPFGIIIGLGCEVESELAAQEHAFIECLRKVVDVVENYGKYIDKIWVPLELIDKSNMGPKEHYHLALNLAYAREFWTNEWFNDKNFSYDVNPQFISFVKLRENLKSPFVFVKAHDLSYQSLFFGHERNINDRRMKSFNPEIKHLNPRYLHPFG